MELELKNLIEQGNATIAALRTEVEGLKSADVVATEKVARIEADLAKNLSEKSALEARLNAMETAAARPGAFGAKGNDAAESEVKAAFMDYLRKPTEAKRAVYEDLAQKSVNISAPADGGVAVIPQYGSQLIEKATEFSPIRSLARVITVSNEAYKEVAGGDIDSGWAGEATARAETTSPAFAEITYKFGEVYSNVRISNHALNDMFFDPWSYVVAKASKEFAVKEGAAFVAGTGVNQPTGFATAGAGVTTVKTGAAATLGTAPADTMIKALYSLKSAYRQNATWLMNTGTLATVASLKDNEGRYILTQPLTAGVPLQLLGRPVATDENVATVAANATPIFIGDFQQAYTILDLQGISVIPDQVTAKGWTIIYVSRRVGGGVTLAEALKGIKVEA